MRWTELQETRHGTALWARVLSPDSALPALPTVTLDDAGARAFGHGQAALVLGAAAGGCGSEEDRGDCGAVATTFLDGDGGTDSPRDALGDYLSDAERVTEDADDSKGFETVTFRGYHTDGRLLETVVVEGGTTWRVARVETCE